MTPEEAIKTIQVAVAEVEWNYPMNYAEAFETAINALETVKIQRAEIERLKKFLAEEEEKYKLCAKRFYKVGVKEFAERYAENFIVLFNLNYEQTEAARELRKRIVKEMVGDTE